MVAQSDRPDALPTPCSPPFQHGLDCVWALLVSGANTEVTVTKNDGERISYRLV